MNSGFTTSDRKTICLNECNATNRIQTYARQTSTSGTMKIDGIVVPIQQSFKEHENTVCHRVWLYSGRCGASHHVPCCMLKDCYCRRCSTSAHCHRELWIRFAYNPSTLPLTPSSLYDSTILFAYKQQKWWTIDSCLSRMSLYAILLSIYQDEFGKRILQRLLPFLIAFHSHKWHSLDLFWRRHVVLLSSPVFSWHECYCFENQFNISHCFLFQSFNCKIFACT